MFTSGMRESSEEEIPIIEIRHAVFVMVLEYIYTGRVDITEETVVGMYNMALSSLVLISLIHFQSC